MQFVRIEDGADRLNPPIRYIEDDRVVDRPAYRDDETGLPVDPVLLHGKRDARFRGETDEELRDVLRAVNWPTRRQRLAPAVRPQRDIFREERDESGQIA